MKTKSELKLLKDLEKVGGKILYCTHNDRHDGRRGTNIYMTISDKVYLGCAECGHKDKFDRKIGRAIALGRAFKNYSQGTDIELPSFLEVKDELL